MIDFQDVTKEFGDGPTTVHAVDHLSFTVPRGGFWALMGPSGSGKSTVLHLIAGLATPTAGAVLVDGRNVARLTRREAAIMRRREVGYVLQSFHLMPFLTVEGNVAMPLALDGVAHSEVRARVAEALALVQMEHRGLHYPRQLSGGEQQRVGIARALAIRPKVLLADEPTGNLDRTAGQSVMNLLRDINTQRGVTVLLVTHDPVFATTATQVLRLSDGRLVHATDLTDDGASERRVTS
jgi:putative ABC transport system ATP-binding protein